MPSDCVGLGDCTKVLIPLQWRRICTYGAGSIDSRVYFAFQICYPVNRFRFFADWAAFVLRPCRSNLCKRFRRVRCHYRGKRFGRWFLWTLFSDLVNYVLGHLQSGVTILAPEYGDSNRQTDNDGKDCWGDWASPPPAPS